MQNAKLKNYLHLHILVFIAGFTAILGELITIGSIPLVWYRMLMAGLLMFLYIKFKKVKIKVDKPTMLKFLAAGVIVSLHWITFFEAIKQSNISIALAMFSTGAFFASFIEPFLYKRRIVWYEILLGVMVVIGVFLITHGELRYINGIILGVVSALLSSLFAVINGTFIRKYSATVISFYEFLSGVAFLTLFILLFKGGFDIKFFTLSASDWMYLFLLASVCTAYAFIGVVKVMKFISPYTVVLSYNLEPVYGIALALLLFPETETMGPQFYYGACLVLLSVMLDAVLKNVNSYRARKRKTH